MYRSEISFGRLTQQHRWFGRAEAGGANQLLLVIMICPCIYEFQLWLFLPRGMSTMSGDILWVVVVLFGKLERKW